MTLSQPQLPTTEWRRERSHAAAAECARDAPQTPSLLPPPPLPLARPPRPSAAASPRLINRSRCTRSDRRPRAAHTLACA
eukprot:5936318-Pleurochrysis_carterae.AAC.2